MTCPLKPRLNVVLFSALGGIYEVVNKVKCVGFNSTAVVVSPCFLWFDFRECLGGGAYRAACFSLCSYFP